ncbi:MAG TPA: alpha/beta fold hydrolase [Rhizomicrobium sp.]|jgi:pimeloyl-ACP methyl ester carboxylesterase
MTRRGKIIAGIAAALVLVLAAGAWFVNDKLYGLPGFVVWRATSGELDGRHRAAIDGVSIYYETYGSGPPVLLLHGAGASLETMYPFITAFAKDHTVIAVDSRAQGRSTDAPGPITYSMMGADMIALLDTLHIAKTDVIGWSDGGIIGLDMAMKHPTRVRRLIAIGANYRPDGVPPETFSSASMREMERGAKSLYDLIAPDPSHFPVVIEKIGTMLKTEPNYMIADLGRIRCPTLIVAGEHDLILRRHTDSLAHAIPGAKEAIVPGASHAGPLEQPGVYTAMARDFLDR